MNKKGKMVSGIITATLVLAGVGVILTAGPSITGAAAGTSAATGMSAFITIFFVLAIVSLIPQTFGKEVQSVRKEAQPTFKDLNSRLAQIDEELNKIF